MGENYEQSKICKFGQGIQNPVFSRNFSAFLPKTYVGISKKPKLSSPAFSPSHRDVVLVPGKEYPLVIPGLKKSVSKPSVLSEKSFNRMVTESSSFLSNCGHLWPIRYGSFRFCSKSPGQEIHVLDKRPRP